MTNMNAQPDVFAQIGSARLTHRSKLTEPKPATLPEKPLPLDTTSKAAFAPKPKMHTADQLDRELQRLREHYSKFMGNQAPPLQSCRTALTLTDFDWRRETPEDRTDFLRVLQGKGPWTQVSLPHYGEPLGRAVTYYRTTFTITETMMQKGSLFVCFDGVDYKARVFVNNACVGEHEGFFAPFECDITPNARLGENTLLVQVANDAVCMGNRSWGQDIDGDKIYAATGLGYDDPEWGWHHCPPAMGIYQDVRIEARDRLFIHDVFVRPIPEKEAVEAWIEIHNCDVSNEPIQLELAIYGQNFSKTVLKNHRYQPRTSQIRGHGDVDQFNNPCIDQLMGPGINYLRIPLDLPQPKTWRPETPWLYQLQLKLHAENDRLCDTAQQHFGMRSFRQDETAEPKGKFYLNDQEIRLRGANTMGHLQKCVMQKNWDQLRDDILLAKICNMNFLRLTQRPVQKAVYDYCDKLGMMTQTDLPLFGVLRRNQMLEAVKQAQEMERLVRPHPCNIIVSYLNEPYPNAMGKPHRHLARPELEEFFAIASKTVRLNNPERVIKCVDGDYDPPVPDGMPDNHCYCGWYNGHALDLGKLHRGYWLPVKPGWFYGCGEFGAEGLDPYNTMQKYYPKKWLPTSPDSPWSPAVIRLAQTERFHYLWYETQKTVQEWIDASQEHQAWIIQLMTEAFRRDARMNTFAIHLFVDAWPAGWMKTIMDCDRQPKKAFFAYRDALAPLMLSLRSDRVAFRSREPMPLEAWICNDNTDLPAQTRLAYQLEIDGNVLQAGQSPANVPACSTACQGAIPFHAPAIDKRTQATARLALIDQDQTVLNHTALTFNLFPKSKPLPQQDVLVFGDSQGPAATLARQIGLQPTFSGKPQPQQTILIDSLQLYQQHQQQIDQAVQMGAQALFLELPTGEHHIAGDTVTIAPCGMGKRQFVSRDTGHPLVRDFQPNDFKFWFDDNAGYVTPLLDSVVSAADWTPILLSGNGNWKGQWVPAPAAIEKKHGNGAYRICQLKLPHRIAANPTAEIFTQRLLSNPWPA